jgi:integrase
VASIQRIVSPLTKSVSYRAQVRVKGRPTHSQTFPNLKEAKAWGASVESAIRENRNHPHLAGGKKSFADLVRRYRESVMNDAGAGSKAVRGHHLTWWDSYFAGCTLADITPDRVADARDALAAEKFTRGRVRKKQGVEIAPTEYTRAGATVNRYLATLSHMFTMAVKEWRLAATNPVRDMSNSERDALLAACTQSDWPALHTLVLLAISTGARRGELINLQWDDVDLRVREASVDTKTGEKRAAMGHAIVRETKNGDTRVLPLVGKALGALRSLKPSGSAKSPWVFAQPSGFPGPYQNFDGVWYDALAAAKIEDFRFHDLRHTTASYLAAQGASLLEIADALGHRTLSMVKRYAHLAQSHKVSAIEKMAIERGL